MNDKIVIFGAGKFGKLALDKHKDKVVYFIDNNPLLIGKKVNGIEVRSLDDYITEGKKYKIIIAGKMQDEIKRQLCKYGVTNYDFFLKSKYSYYETENLIYNPYENEENRDLDEKSWNEINSNSFKIELIKKEVDKLYESDRMFDHIEIETINRTNEIKQKQKK